MITTNISASDIIGYQIDWAIICCDCYRAHRDELAREQYEVHPIYRGDQGADQLICEMCKSPLCAKEARS